MEKKPGPEYNGTSRWEFASALYPLGISLIDVAKYLECATSTLQRDAKIEGGGKYTDLFPNRPTIQTEIYQACFKKYAEICVSRALESLDEKIAIFLQQWLKIDHMLCIYEGYRLSISLLTDQRPQNPKDPLEKKLHQLAVDLFPELNPVEPERTAEEWLRHNLVLVARGTKKPPINQNDRDFFVDLTDEIQSVDKKTKLDPRLVHTLKEVINELEGMEKQVIEWLFFTEKRPTYNEIGQAMKLDRGVANRIAENALKKIRERTRARLADAKIVVTHGKPSIENKDAFLELLKLEVESLDVSLRLKRNLCLAGITTLGQLVRLTENELLIIPNIGNKSIREIIKTLKERGLEIDMDSKLGEDITPLFLLPHKIMKLRNRRKLYQ